MFGGNLIDTRGLPTVNTTGLIFQISFLDIELHVFMMKTMNLNQPIMQS